MCRLKICLNPLAIVRASPVGLIEFTFLLVVETEKEAASNLATSWSALPLKNTQATAHISNAHEQSSISQWES